jgi:precorrin-2 dehydrogenase / sirohydrochlorin ferrochelatase
MAEAGTVGWAMYPILLDLSRLRIMLVGNGAAALRRLRLLDADGAQHVTVFADAPHPELAAAAGARVHPRLPTPGEVRGFRILFLCEQNEPRFDGLLAAAREAGLLVNVEDEPQSCDFHSAAMVRRGDLLFTVSTNGQCPALTRRLRRFLEERFGPEWRHHLDEIAALRRQWRAEGADAREIIRRADEWVERRGWLRPGPKAR